MSGPGAYTGAGGSREGEGFDGGFCALGMSQQQGAHGGLNAAQHQQMAQHPQHAQNAQHAQCVPPFMQQETLALAMQRQPHHAYTQHLQTRVLDGAAAGRGGEGGGPRSAVESPALSAAGHSSAGGVQHHHRPLDGSSSVLTFGGCVPQNLRGTSDPQALDEFNDTVVLWEDTVIFFRFCNVGLQELDVRQFIIDYELSHI